MSPARSTSAIRTNSGQRTGRAGDRADRLAVAHRLPAAAAGRSAAALPDITLARGDVRLGAARGAGRRSDAHDRVFRPHADRAGEQHSGGGGDSEARSEALVPNRALDVDRRRLAADQIRHQPAVAAPAVSPTWPWPKACTTSAQPLAGPMHGSPSGVDGRWPIQTFTFSVGRSPAGREIRAARSRAAPRRVASSALHRARPAPPARPAADPAASSRTPSSRRSASPDSAARCLVRDQRVVATLGLQRHAIAGGGGQYLRPGSGGDHCLVRCDLARVGAHSAQAPPLDAKAERPAPPQFGAQCLA